MNKMSAKQMFKISVLLLILTIVSIKAQNVQYTSNSNAEVGLSSRIDPSSLGLNLSIQLANYPGRQSSLPVVFRYSSKIWNIRFSGSEYDVPNSRTLTYTEPVYSESSFSGWSNSLSVPVLDLQDAVRRYDDLGNGVDLDNPHNWNYNDPYWVVPRIKIHMPDGSVREFRRGDWIAEFHYGVTNNPDIWIGDFYSVDGSRMRYNLNDRTLYLPDGSRYLHEPNSYNFTKFIDANGNILNYTANYVTDTMGRQIPFLPLPPQTPQDTTYTIPGLNGAPTNYVFKWKNLGDSLTTNQQLRYLGDCSQLSQPLSPSLFQGEVNTGFVCDSIRAIFNPMVLSEIVLPNGTAYKFSYNVWGEIDKIIYPTGAYERFEYATIWGTAYTGDPYFQSNRGVVKKWLSKDGNSTNEILWQYGNPSHGVFYTLFPDNTKSERIYDAPFTNSKWGFEDKRVGQLLEEKFYNSNGVLVKRTLNDYQILGVTGTVPSLPGGTFATLYASANRDSHPSRSISIGFEPNATEALVRMSEINYDSNSNLAYFAHLNPKQIKNYGYLALDLNTAKTANLQTIADSFANKLPLSIHESDYLYDLNHLARNIIGLTSETRMLNPANPSVIFSRSQNIFDEQNLYYSLIDYGSTTTGYENPTGVNANLRGNPTTRRTWNNDTNSWIETHTQFDNFGNVRKVWDSTNSQTRFSETDYDPVYKYAYTTKVKAPAPDPTGVHGMTSDSEISRTFDFMTGLILSVTDSNGQTATTEYDSALRPIRLTPPAGGSSSETIYNDDVNNPWIKVREQIDENNWAEQTTFLDKLGRAYKTQTKDIQGDIFTEVKYDNVGRVEKTSNPYRQGDQIFWSKPTYDEVGRVVETFAPAPDGSTGISLGKIEFGISTVQNFVGPYVISKDASNRQLRAITGDYGILRVDEATGFSGNITIDLGALETPNQPTFYSYNVKGELIKIVQSDPNQPSHPVQNRYFMYDSLGRMIRVRQPEQTPNSNLNTTGNPENNQWTGGYTYDILGNVIRITDANGVNVINEYDKIGRRISRCHTKPQIQTASTQCSQLSSSEVSLNTPQVDYYYDGKGLPQIPQFSRGALTKVTSSVSENRYTGFDNNGRLLASQQITDGQAYNFSYKYNLSGGLIEETYPSGRIVKNFTDSDGGLATVSSKAATGQFQTFATNFDYFANGGVKAMMLGNGRWETAQFNELNQLKQLGLGTSSTDKSLWKVDYEYGELSEDGTSVDTVKNNGNIARQTITIPTTSFVQTYKYDALNRLREAKETGTSETQNWKQTFSYDAFGNRTGFYQKVGNDVLVINNLTLPQIDPYTNRFTTGQGYVYDFNGNLVQDAQNRSFSFTGEDKQNEVRDLTISTSSSNPNANVIGRYYYDGSGSRVKKVSNTELTVFVYDGSGTLAAEYSTQLNPEPQTSYLTTDHLGSPRVITDKNGNVISRRDFMPFGEEVYAGVGGRTTALKYSFVGADSIRQRFTSYQKDTETNLDFAGGRMYQNNHARFTSVDPLMSSSSALNPQSFNRYTYTGNNPVNRTDPNGLRWVSDANSTEVYWIADDDPLNGRTDMTNQIRTISGCDVVAGCFNKTTVKFNSTRSVDVKSDPNAVVIKAEDEQIDGNADVISTDAGSLGNIIFNQPTAITGFAPTIPTTGVPTIDLPTGPGPGPLEPIDPSGGGDLDPGDVGGGDIDPGDVATAPSDDWKVTAAKIAFFTGYVWWNTRGSSDGNDDNNEEEWVYHGTDSNSADDIVRNGLDEDKWKNSDDEIDTKGFSVTRDPVVARQWAETRALLRGGTPQVISAKRSDLQGILNKGGKGYNVDKKEEFILPKDFPKVPGGVFWYED